MELNKLVDVIRPIQGIIHFHYAVSYHELT